MKTLGADYAVSSVIIKPTAPIKSADDYIKLIAALTQDDYKKMAAELNTMGSQAKSAGIQFAYHNHNMEFQKWSDGGTPYDTLMAETDPSLVKIELDCGWADLGGRSPLEVFRKYPGRVRMLHIKDFAPVGHPVVTLDRQQVPEPTELGKGHIDYRPILAAARERASNTSSSNRSLRLRNLRCSKRQRSITTICDRLLRACPILPHTFARRSETTNHNCL